MAAGYELSNVVTFFRRATTLADWTNQELANFYRVEDVLVQNGMSIDVDRGTTDEGDPWFVFCHRDGDVFLHFARVRGGYLVAGPNIPQPLWNKDFTDLLRSLEDRVPFVLPSNSRGGATVLMHPSVLLVAAVAAYFYQSASVKADEQAVVGGAPTRNNEARGASPFILSDFQAATLIAAIALMAGVETLNIMNDPYHGELGAIHNIDVSFDAEMWMGERGEGTTVVAKSEERDAVPTLKAAIVPARVDAIDAIVVAAAPIPADFHQTPPNENLDDTAASVSAVQRLETSEPQVAMSVDTDAGMSSPSLPIAAGDDSSEQKVAKVDFSDVVAQKAELDIEEAAAAEKENSEDTPSGKDNGDLVSVVAAEVKYFITTINGIYVLIENNAFNFPNGPSSDMKSFDDKNADIDGDADVSIVGSSTVNESYDIL